MLRGDGNADAVTGYCRVARMDLGGRNALDATWNNVVLFLETFDPRQIRHAHDIFRRLFEAFYAHAVDTQKVGFPRVSYSLTYLC